MYYIKNSKIVHANRGAVRGMGWLERADTIICRPSISKNFSHELLGVRYVLRKNREYTKTTHSIPVS